MIMSNIILWIRQCLWYAHAQYKVIMTSRLLICILLQTQNNESNLEIIYSKFAERCRIFNFHRKTGSMQCLGCFFCLLIVNSKGLACRHSIKHKISDNKLFMVIQWRTFLKMVDFKPFFYTKNVIEERANYCKFLIPISNFLSHFVSTDTAKAIFEVSLCALKIIVLIVGRKVLTYLVTSNWGVHTFGVIVKVTWMAKF